MGPGGPACPPHPQDPSSSLCPSRVERWRKYRRGGRGGDKYCEKKVGPGPRCSGATGRLAERDWVAPNKRAGGDKFFSHFCCARRLALSDARGRPANPTRVDREPAAGRGSHLEQVRLPLMRSPRAPAGSPQGSRSAQTRERAGVRGGKEFRTSGRPSPAPSGHPLPIEVQEWGEGKWAFNRKFRHPREGGDPCMLEIARCSGLNGPRPSPG